MGWSEKDLQNIQSKGFKVNDSKGVESGTFKPKAKIEKVSIEKVSIEKVSIEKNTIELFLMQFKQAGLIKNFDLEYQFDIVRKFRFDYAIQEKMIAIEYEGIMSKKSRHTTVGGYSKDIEKYNLAVLQGWRVLRYTALNYKDLYKDLEKIL